VERWSSTAGLRTRLGALLGIIVLLTDNLLVRGSLRLDQLGASRCCAAAGLRPRAGRFAAGASVSLTLITAFIAAFASARRAALSLPYDRAAVSTSS
jgi:hypothetical protein